MPISVGNSRLHIDTTGDISSYKVLVENDLLRMAPDRHMPEQCYLVTEWLQIAVQNGLRNSDPDRSGGLHVCGRKQQATRVLSHAV